MKKQYIRGELPKKGELEQFADLGGGRGWGWSSLAKKREVEFLRGGGDTQMHTTQLQEDLST